MVKRLMGFFSSFNAATAKAITSVAPINIASNVGNPGVGDAGAGWGVDSGGCWVGVGVGTVGGVGVGTSGEGLGVGVASGTVSSPYVRPMVGSCSSV